MQVILTTPDPYAAKSNDVSSFIPNIDSPTSNKDLGVATGAFEDTLTTPNLIGHVTYEGVRRPLNGIAVKPNTNAYVQVVSVDSGETQFVFNELGSSTSRNAVVGLPDHSPQHKRWTDWSLQSVSEQRLEKIQIVETFGDPIFYAYGERPRTLTFKGVLLNTADFPWEAQFWENWDKYFRATRLVESGNQLMIGFDDVIVTGYPIAAIAEKTSSPTNNIVYFNFQLYITSYTNLVAQNIGVLQRARRQMSSNLQFKPNTPLGSEYAPQGTYDDGLFSAGLKGDDSSEVANNSYSTLQRVIGGDRLKFAEHYKKLFGWSQGTFSDVSLADLLFSSSARYIKGAKTATDFLYAHTVRQALKYSYKGIRELASVTPGGLLGLNFWFGLIGHMYKVSFGNAFNNISSAGVDTSKWGGWQDKLGRMGNPFFVASTIAYAPINATFGAIYEGIGRYEDSNARYVQGIGVVGKGQPGTYGAAISQRRSYSEANTTSALLFTGKSADSTQVVFEQDADATWASPKGVADAKNSFDTSESSAWQQALDEKNTKADNEQLAVAEQKKKTGKHGDISIIDDGSEIEDDGSEE